MITIGGQKKAKNTITIYYLGIRDVNITYLTCFGLLKLLRRKSHIIDGIKGK